LFERGYFFKLHADDVMLIVLPLFHFFHPEVKIVDRRGRPCKPGQVGEINVWGSIMMTELPGSG
jgi:hypothetical protein